MNNLKKKLKKQGGFTLIEMLIVVAIIAILIAISIPLVGSALEKAREATDASNERSFKAELTTSYLLGEADMGAEGATAFDPNQVYCYDAVNGKLTITAPTNAYGQGKDGAGNHTGAGSSHEGLYLWGYVDKTDGAVYMMWSETGPQASAIKTTGATTLTSLVIVNTTTSP